MNDTLEISGMSGREKQLIAYLSSDQCDDVIMVEAIRAVSRAVDSEIRRTCESGTTATTVFIRKKRAETDGLRILGKFPLMNIIFMPHLPSEIMIVLISTPSRKYWRLAHGVFHRKKINSVQGCIITVPSTC
jgi:hypothetical protein